MQESDLKLVQAFLNKEPTNEVEKKLKTAVNKADEDLVKKSTEYNNLVQLLEKTRKEASDKQREVNALSQKLEGLCELIIDLQTADEESNSVS